MQKISALFLISAALLLALSACGGSASGSYSSAAVAEEDAKFNMLVTAFASDDDMSDVIIRGETQNEREMSSGAAESAAPADGVETEGSAAAPSVEAQAPVEQKIIKTVDIRMESKEYDASVHGINDAIEAAGGYIEHSDIAGNIAPRGTPENGALSAGLSGLEITPLGGDVSGSQSYREGERRYLGYRIRVPQEALESFIAEIERYGNVLSRKESAVDVTLDYVDIEAHKAALLLEQEQLLEMLASAVNVEDIIRLQERLADVRYQIESLESQMRVLMNRVSYSTVNLTLQEVIDYTKLPVYNPTVGQRVSTGFAQTLEDIKNFWVNQFVWTMVNSIYIITVLVVLAVLVVLLRRRSRRRALLAAERKTLAEPAADNAEAPADDAKKNE